MPVETEYEPKTFNCDGSQTEFSVSFRINETSDAKVYLRDTEVADPNDGQTLLAEETHYSISAPNNEYGDGFKVTTVATYANTYKLIVARDLAETQTAAYIENDSFPSKGHENVVDKLCMLVQELKAINPRLLKLAITSAYSDLTLPDPVAEYLLAWKADKSGLKNVTGANIGDLTISDFIKDNLLDDANVAAAQATLEVDNIVDTNKLKTGVEYKDAQTGYYSVPLIGYDVDTDVNAYGYSILWTGVGYARLPVNLPNGATVTELYSYAFALPDNVVTISLQRCAKDSETPEAMANTQHVGVGAVTDDTITNAVIDKENYKYYVYCNRTVHTNDAIISMIRIKYTVTKPLP